MASYFEEHDCRPLEEGETPNHTLHLARLLLDGGWSNPWDTLYTQLMGEAPPPPASVRAIQDLKMAQAKDAQDKTCSICLGTFEKDDIVMIMPCKHNFHPKCLKSWLEKTNSCPVCRYELETDNEEYENYKKEKKRKQQREYELETLHNSMFG